jgi:hypothetical protein
MYKIVKYTMSLLALSVVVVGISVRLAPAQQTGMTLTRPEKEAEETLGNQLRAAAEQQMLIGKMETNNVGEKVFSGETADKMKKLHAAAERQIDAMIARPEGQRQPASASIAAFAEAVDSSGGKARSSARKAIEYKRTTRSSYQRDVPVEIYHSDGDQYEVDIRNNHIIQFGPRPEPDQNPSIDTYDFTPRYTEMTLNKIARKFAESVGADFVSKPLTPSTNNKEDLVYFFRWEDRSRMAEGLYPFVQVGISRGGQVVSFTNTLDLPAQDVEQKPAELTVRYAHASHAVSNTSAPPFSATGVWIFANNGNNYSEYGPSNYWWTTYNEGYCGHLQTASWCVPRYMRYTYESKSIWTPSNYARWSHPGWDGGWGSHKVFIPRVNATTMHASYMIVYSGGSTYSFGINQLAYSDAWVPSTRLYAIGATWLYDTPWGGTTPTGKKVGFDEIQIVY